MKNLMSNFGVIHVGNMHTEFQASSITGVKENEVTGTRDVKYNPYTKSLNSPLRFARFGKDNKKMNIIVYLSSF